MKLRGLRTFGADERGGVVVAFGVGIIVLLLAIGLAIDTLRMHNTWSKVQAALDAATLAGAKMLGGQGASDSEIRVASEAFFKAQLENMKVSGVTLNGFHTQINRNGSAVVATVDVSLPTVFSQVGGGLTKVDFSPTSSAVFKQKKIELSLVLDITGSMAPAGKIDALKVAAQNLVDTLFAANPQPGAVRVALVPYAASVNAGSFHAAVTAGGSSGGYSNWNSWSGWSVGATDTCVVERAGSYAYTDTTPGAGSYLGVSSSAANPQYSCPTPTVVPLADLANAGARTSFKASIDALTPSGATAGHIGAAWGWYTLLPSWSYLWPASTPEPFSDDVKKIVILMTDGEFNTSYENGAMNSTNYGDVGSSGYQALEICNGMKADNITIYTIAFMAPTNAETLLRTCSGDANFYSADTSSQLFSSFQDIVSKLTELRISS